MTECSIVIPTYNRSGYLKRILSYYNDSHVVCNIIVADGSSDKIKKLNKETVSSFPGIKIQHLDKYSFETPLDVRIADALEHVTTKHCVFCADDDFIILNGIKQVVDFLEKNPDFAAAHGRYISFHLEDDGKGKQQFCWKPAYSNESITFSDPETGLSHHLSDYSQPTFQAVYRTDVLKLILEENAKLMLDGLLAELLLSMLTVIYGKVKCLDVLYSARDAGSPTSGGYRRDLNDAIENGIYDDEYAKFRECLAQHLCQQSQLDAEASRKIVDGAMFTYLKKAYPSKINMGYITTKIGQTLDNLHLPGWLNRGIRKPYKEFIEPRYIKKYSKDMPSSSKYYEDFDRVRRHVLSFAKISS